MAAIALEDTEILNKANQLYLRGKINESLEFVSKLIEQNSSLEKAYRLQAACYYQLKQYDEVRKSSEELLKINDTVSEDHFNLAHIHLLQNNIDLAVEEYNKGLSIDPHNIKALLTLSEIYINQNKESKACELLKKILSRYPEHVEAQYKLALIEKNKEAIITSLKKLVRQRPLDIDIRLKLANFYLNNADFNNAAYYITQAITINANFFPVNFIAGLHANYLKKWDEAIKYFCNALREALDNPLAHFELSKNYLIQEQFKKGWQAFEWRKKFSQPHYVNSLLNEYLHWHGESLKNKHVLIYAEPNYGSTFLFLRYLDSIKQKNTKITLLVPSQEIEAIKQFDIVDKIVSEHDQIHGKIDYIASLLSIPDIKNLDAGEASLTKYLQLTVQTPSSKFKKIGLSWHTEETILFSNINKIELDLLGDIIKSINAEFFCLHPHALTSSELAWCKQNNIILRDSINNKGNLLSLVNDLDLVITQDNEVAHMAASIDKPTWVMTSFISNWYLGNQDQKTIWYPAMRLFRQRKINDWLFVIRQIISTLFGYAASTGYTLSQPENIAVEKAKKLFTEKQFTECINFCNETHKQYPKQAAFFFFSGIAASALHDNNLAISYLLQAESLDRNNADTYNNLGTLYYRTNEINQALFCFERAVELNPNNPEFLKNLAISYFELGVPEKSIALYKKALSIKDSIENHFGYSLQLLGMGAYEEGWREYEYRLQMPQHNYRLLKLNTPLWDGSNLDKKTIFIVCEQGLGDNIQFLRFLPFLKQHYDCRIIFGGTANILRLVKQFSDIDQIICTNEVVPQHDYHLNIMSLAMHFKIYHESQLMADKPYIIAHPTLCNYWQQILAGTKTLKIGFCWSGNPKHVNNLRRNCNLFDFIKLLHNKKIKLYSLQKNISSEEKEFLSAAGIDDLGELFDDLADAAAAMSQLDLVLSIDSALAHLAGALGKKTWLLLPYYTEWRHPLNHEYSPWYSCIKFYPQTTAGDWSSVFRQVDHDLSKITEEHGQGGTS